jgi:type I restriction enzyme R subunit
MAKITSEYAFEEHIEEVLLKTHGYFPAQQADYDKALCLRPETVISFIRATQTKKWADYCELIGDKGQATRNLLKRIKEVVDKEGTLHALRRAF